MTAANFFSEAAIPSTGEVFYYMVAAVNACGEGPFEPASQAARTAAAISCAP